MQNEIVNNEEQRPKRYTTERMDAVHKVGSRAQLSDILITESHCIRDNQQFDIKNLVPQNLVTAKAVETKPVGKDIWADILLGYRLVETDEEENVTNIAIEISAKYLLFFKLKSRRGITKQDVADFCSINGAHMAWPYWREFVQSQAARMGYPGILLKTRPPISLPPERGEEQIMVEKPKSRQ